MDDTERAAIVAAIEAAAIGPAYYRTSRRLLDLVEHGWHITITVDQACAITGSTTWKGARGHLSKLAAAGLIHYSTNQVVYVNFYPQAPQNRAQRPQNRAQRPNFEASARDSEADENALASKSRAETPKSRAETPKSRAETPKSRAEGHTYVVSQSVSNLLDQKLTDRRVLDLLTDPDIGMSDSEANRYAAAEPELIVRQIFAWFRDRDAGKVSGLGALHHRLRSNWGAPALTEAEKRTDFYRRHHPTADVGLDGTTAGVRRKYAINVEGEF